MAARELAVHRVAAAPRVGAVHDVVVHERERVHELERGRGVDHAPDRRGRHPRRRTRTRRTRAAGACRRRRRTRAALRADRRARRRPRSSASSSAVEQLVDARLDPVGDRIERCGEGRGARRPVEAMARGYAAGSEPVGIRRRSGLACAPVAEFLSDEWIAALATRAARRVGSGVRRRSRRS